MNNFIQPQSNNSNQASSFEEESITIWKNGKPLKTYKSYNDYRNRRCMCENPKPYKMEVGVITAPMMPIGDCVICGCPIISK